MLIFFLLLRIWDCWSPLGEGLGSLVTSGQADGDPGSSTRFTSCKCDPLMAFVGELLGELCGSLEASPQLVQFCSALVETVVLFLTCFQALRPTSSELATHSEEGPQFWIPNLGGTLIGPEVMGWELTAPVDFMGVVDTRPLPNSSCMYAGLGAVSVSCSFCS